MTAGAQAPPVALVTGAAQGLGLAIVERLGADGFTVLMGDIQLDVLEREAARLRDAGHDPVPVHLDVTDAASVAAALSVLDATDRSLDALVNNAGIISRAGAAELDPARFDVELAVNLGGVVRCSQAAYPYLRRSGRAAIVNLASVGSTFGLPLRLGYATSKTGVLGLTRTLAAEWGPDGIRTNAVAPGYVETPMMLSGFETGALDRDLLLGRTPMRRFGRSPEIAAAVAFLVSVDASFVNGAVLPVDGGITVDGTFHRV